MDALASAKFALTLRALPPNKRFKLPARVEYCMTAFSPARRSLSAIH
jgi:hypothetical protein